MKRHRIMAEQNDGSEVLYKSRKDRWTRKAKHPMPLAEKSNVSLTWEVGESALYEGSTVTILTINGPNDTVKILSEYGVPIMVKEKSLKKLDEHVMGGLQTLGSINRMMQLAGIASHAIIETNTQIDEAADATNMFNSLVKANLAGEYKNNPDAATLATVGQIMVSLNSVVEPIKEKIDPNLSKKLETAIGLGALIIQSAKKMTKAEQ